MPPAIANLPPFADANVEALFCQFAISVKRAFEVQGVRHMLRPLRDRSAAARFSPTVVLGTKPIPRAFAWINVANSPHYYYIRG
jgi:hypothetical protein